MTHIDTACVQGGYTPKNGEPRCIPIVQSTTFKYDSSEEMAKLFRLEAPGYFYSRLQNPTCDHVAAKIAALEGGSGAVLTGSGQAASFFAIFNICGAGGHVICMSEIYGGTHNLISVTMKRMGIESTFIPVNSPDDELARAIRPNTRLIFGETISNPSLAVLDIERVAAVAHRHGIPLVVDNTFATPIHCRPLDWGADIVTHSTTKYMDGHGVTVGGVVVDGGKFPWSKHADRFPELSMPDASYNNLVYTERFGDACAYHIKMIAQLMRDLGSVQAPMNAFMMNIGLESLHLRIKRHSENAEAIARFLADHPKVAYVNHCSLPSHRHRDLVKKYLPNGSCGVVSFGVKAGKEAAERFMSRLKRINISTHVCDAWTCILHPASSTHGQMNNAELKAAGITPDFVRMSVGIENAGDLIEDLRQAFE